MLVSEERIGFTNRNYYGSEMKIIKYKDGKNIWVEFDDGTIVKTMWNTFKNGRVVSPFNPTVSGIGYIGVGKYTSKERIGKEAYERWYSMLNRCYGRKENRNVTYKDASVAEVWFNFQNFAEWHEQNYYEIGVGKMGLDKDILVKGNRVYSPETCIYVPQRINSLFVKGDKVRGKLPIGVSYNTNSKGYMGCCCIGERKRKNLGTYATPEEAFYTYKNFKENFIKEVAEEYKDKIPEKLYNALLSYKVEIDD